MQMIQKYVAKKGRTYVDGTPKIELVKTANSLSFRYREYDREGEFTIEQTEVIAGKSLAETITELKRMKTEAKKLADDIDILLADINNAPVI